MAKDAGVTRTVTKHACTIVSVDACNVRVGAVCDGAPIEFSSQRLEWEPAGGVRVVGPVLAEHDAGSLEEPADEKPGERIAAQGAGEHLPSKIGDCVVTRIKQVGCRLSSGGVDVPNSGTSISYEDGLEQISYEQDPNADLSMAGDEARVCLVELPKDCSPGDDRGKVYRATNLRTGRTWTMPDSEHGCGGA